MASIDKSRRNLHVTIKKLADATMRARLHALYDHCIIEWRSDIQVLDDKDNASDITCNRDNLLELAELRGLPEIVSPLESFEAECTDAGRLIAEDDEGTLKNLQQR